MADQVPDGLAETGARIRSAQAVAQLPAGAGDHGAHEITGIGAAFPVWNVWRSDEGCWWATRNRPLRPSQWPEGYALTVTAGDARGLCEQITHQPG